jgi:hypothetical protein
MAKGRTVDAAFVRAVAYKRIFTACASACASIALVYVVASRHTQEPRSLAMTALALAIFIGGGAWSLKDGLRLVRELRGKGTTS